eukprot:Nitzschia sp. Nitz4//scaffold86_size83305//69354//70676//NITZ4_005272-RA/size83305-processed-gene-0.12-mRNA-1//1//CDS//3329559280//4497//frame0
MGSFHSESVDHLMGLPDNDYVSPPLPFSSTTPEFDSDFLLDRANWTFINHGAFGAALSVGYHRAQEWRLHLERQPLRYFDRDLLPHMVESARRLAKFCNAPRETTTLIPNVTFGLNTVLRGYTRTFSKNSHIILWDTSYGSLKKMAHHLCPRVTEIPVSNYFHRFHDGSLGDPSDVFELAFTETMQTLDQPLEDHALFILDHTTSNTALNMPLNKMSQIARQQHSMLVMVDGAHGLLAQPVDIGQLPYVDFYLGNGHKWLSCPRGIGLMYCRNEELRETILEEPAVMSHGLGEGFQSRYLWDGCRDYAAALSVPAVLDFWEGKDVQSVQQTLKSKLNEAVAVLGQAWHNRHDAVTLAPLSVHAPMMALVLLPQELQHPMASATSTDAKCIQDYLFDHAIEVPIKCINGTLYVRISAHVYNEHSEYIRLAEVLLKYNNSTT